EGRALSSEEAVAEALAGGLAPPPTTSRPPQQAGPLTERERGGAALVARGLTNRQIATELGVTERTIAAPVERSPGKHGFASRTQIGVWAAAQDARAGTT